jgi:hypothetical protein
MFFFWRFHEGKGLVDPKRFELFEHRAPSEQDRATNLDIWEVAALHPVIDGADRFVKPSSDSGLVQDDFVSRQSGGLTLRVTSCYQHRDA